MSQVTASTSLMRSDVNSNKMFLSPPIELVQRQETALETLRTSLRQLRSLPTLLKGRNVSKSPARARHILANHHDSLAMFLSTEFVTAISLISEYGKHYAEVPAHMYFYAQLADPELTDHFPPGNHRVRNELEGLNAAIIVPWRLCQEIIDNLGNTQNRLKGLLASLKYSAEWTDEVLYGETKGCSESWNSDLLSDVIARLEELKESYSPLISYFKLQEVHLRLLQERVLDDTNSQLDTRNDFSVRGLTFPSPPAMRYPWHTVRRRAIKFVMVWRAFSDSEIFASLNSERLLLLEDIRVASKLEHSKRRRVSDRVKGAFNHVSCLFSASEINAH